MGMESFGVGQLDNQQERKVSELDIVKNELLKLGINDIQNQEDINYYLSGKEDLDLIKRNSENPYFLNEVDKQNLKNIQGRLQTSFRIRPIIEGRVGNTTYNTEGTEEQTQENFSTKQLEDAQSIEEINDYFENTDVYIGNENKGMDHSEHILKRIDMGIALGDLDLIPDDLKLRDTVFSVLEKQGIETNELHSFDQQRYGFYLRDKTGVSLSENEMRLVTEKMSPEIWGSIDKAFEKTIVLINAIDKVQTTASCAGHLDTTRKGYRHFGDAYLNFTSENQQFTELIKQMATREDGLEIQFFDDGNNRYGIYCRQLPTQNWITNIHKLNPEQIFNKGAKEVSEFLGERVIFEYDASITNNENFKKFEDSMMDIAEKTIEKNNFTNEQTNAWLKDLYKLNPENQAIEEYKDYFTSDEAKNKRDQFIQKIERIAAQCLEQNT